MLTHPLPTRTHPPRRQCCAGLQSIANMAAAIQAGYIDVGIAGGIEFFTKGEERCFFSFFVCFRGCLLLHGRFIALMN